MLFNSYTYLAFLTLCVVLYWTAPERWRLTLLILFGSLFYLDYSPIYFLLILGLACTVFAAGRHRLTGRSDHAIGACVLLVLLVFILFKYEHLFIATIFGGTRAEGALGLIMPLGISFFIFEFIHYLTDIARGKIRIHPPGEFFAFTLFFPTMISGPIKRFQPFVQSLSSLRFRPDLFWQGTLLIIAGFFQKYVLADPLIQFTANLAHPEVIPTTLGAQGGLFAYSLRLYWDFAGLSNVAIGSALLFGITVPQNFHLPYLSRDIQDFWRRWHMSLSSWVRDYIYITLGGNRRGKVMTLLNLTLAMTIVGLWHGAGWNFAVWGLYHGIGLSLHRLWYAYGPRWHGFVWSVIGWISTFLFVTIGWAFFVTQTFSDSLLLLSKAFPIF